MQWACSCSWSFCWLFVEDGFQTLGGHFTADAAFGQPSHVRQVGHASLFVADETNQLLADVDEAPAVGAAVANRHVQQVALLRVFLDAVGGDNQAFPFGVVVVHCSLFVVLLLVDRGIIARLAKKSSGKCKIFAKNYIDG